MFVEILDERRRQQRRVRGHREIHVLPGTGRGRFGVGHHLLDQRHVGERLAAEEDDVDAIARRACLEQQVDTACGGDEIHLAAIGRLGKIFLVAVRARQITAGVHVEHQRAQGIGTDLDAARIDGAQAPRRLQHLESAQFGCKGAHAALGVAAFEQSRQLIDAAPARLAAVLDQGQSERVDAEYGRGRYVQQVGVRVGAHQMSVPRIPFQSFGVGLHVVLSRSAECSSAARSR